MLKRARKYIHDSTIRNLHHFIPAPVPGTDKRLAVLRLDAIGDYVLFRNFLELLRNSERYHGYKISLIGNMVWKELAEEFDRRFVDSFIWIDRKFFRKSIRYRLNKLREVRSVHYDVLINPVYSRDELMDTMVKEIAADERIGFAGSQGNEFYTRYVYGKPGIEFEFYRNVEFFSQLLNLEVGLKRPALESRASSCRSIPYPYALIFIGASNPRRKWDARNFCRVAEYLNSRFGLKPVLCGGPGDLQHASDFRNNFNGHFLDMVGKTTLVELVDLLQGAQVVVTNETSVPHFAVALGKENIFVISNGNHYLRFSPYPVEMCNGYHLVLHPDLRKRDVFELFWQNSFSNVDLNINDIGSDLVIDSIERNLTLTPMLQSSLPKLNDG